MGKDPITKVRIIRKIFSHTFKIIERFLSRDAYIFVGAYQMCDFDFFLIEKSFRLRSNLVHTIFNVFMNYKS